MAQIKEYKVKAYPSDIEVFYYHEEGHLHQTFDKGTLKLSKAKIKDIQEDIFTYINSEPNYKITKKLSYEIAKKIKWYI